MKHFSKIAHGLVPVSLVPVSLVPVSLVLASLVLASLVAIALPAQADPIPERPERSYVKAPELHLVMDLNREQPGLEKVFKSQVERPIAIKACPDRLWTNKLKRDVIAKFQIEPANGGKQSTFFEYRIGTNLAVYWIAHLSEVRHINNDGIIDLVFYAGDDTSDETVLLLRRADSVKAVYAGSQGLSRRKRPSNVGEIDLGNGKTSKWDPDREVFQGDGVAWTTDNCVPLHKTPDNEGEIVFSIYENNIVELLEKKGDWQKINTDGAIGWVESRYLSNTSPTKIFPIK
jgi:hypothetical protein